MMNYFSSEPFLYANNPSKTLVPLRQSREITEVQRVHVPEESDFLRSSGLAELSFLMRYWILITNSPITGSISTNVASLTSPITMQPMGINYMHYLTAIADGNP
jgi:hypothetical protein